MPTVRKRQQTGSALVFVGPFVLAYLVLFIYPTLKMVALSFTNAPLIGEGKWVGWSNYLRLAHDNLFLQSVGHTIYFVVLTVIPTTLLGLVIAMMVLRLRGTLQSLVLAAFFLPYILPVTVVYRIWEWMIDPQFGIAQLPIRLLLGHSVAMWSDPLWAMPTVAFITIWWTNGFNVLLFIAGLKNISQDVHDAASLDGAHRWSRFRYITWPLIWPVTALVLTIQLILQLKIFDQVYLMTQGGPFNSTYVVVQYIYKQAFQSNHGGYGATVAVVLFVAIAALSALQFQGASREALVKRLTPSSFALTVLTLLAACLWAFPLYWGIITSLKPEYEVIEPGIRLIPRHWTLDAYFYVFANTAILRWYFNSTGTAVAITVLVLILSAGCAYALSQLRFPGQYLLYGLILASFMVPIQALIVTHFVLMSSFGLIDSWLGVILPQLIVPVTVIVYKQFFDSIPKEFREAALLDGANEFQIFGRIYLPMNWGVTTALAIITFIGAWNNFLWPFLVANSNASMTVTVGITQVHENFGVQYARNLAGAVIAALPVALAYLVFQRRVTEAIMLSAGVKG